MPSSVPLWNFGPFALDSTNACLWRGAEAVVLSPKAFDVLHYLVMHPDRLVTKDELLDAVWPGTTVTDAVVRVAIGALRKALDDTPPSRFIATVPRRGYRFLAPVTVTDAAARPAATPAPQASLAPVPPPLLVGREALLQRLGEAWAQARQGQRQVVWVTGEAGMGKTAVVEAFRAAVGTDPAVWLAAGQCVEHYGTGEAYLPVLEVLGQLCRGDGGERLVTLLRQQAPTWLVQMPWLLTAAHREQLRDALQGTTRERMLRECAEVVDTLTAETPLVLIFEDLHWSDYATLDLLALLARRRTLARLLVVGTYRPVEALVHHHPLRTVVQDLQRHGHATEIPLALLSAEAVGAYLAVRFPQQQLPAALAPWLHQRTDGHPLFLVTLVEALVERGWLHEHDGDWPAHSDIAALTLEVPEGLRQLLAQQVTRLPLEAQRVLAVASVAGMEFAAAGVAAGLDTTATTVEEHCDALVRRQWLRPLGVTTWPNGTVATHYTFVHALYQQVVYQGLGAGRRVRLHLRLGRCLEMAYGGQAGEIAAELAEHFVRGQDTPRAVRYLHQAADNAIHRCAHRGAIHHLTRGLELLTAVPETPERLHHELNLQLSLGAAWARLSGWSAPEVEQAYARARTLCQRLGEPPQLSTVLRGQITLWVQRAAWQTAYEFAEHLLTLAQRQADPVLLLTAHSALGGSLFCRGEVAAAHAHFAQGSALYRPAYHGALVAHHGPDLGVHARCYVALSLWLRGAPAQALAQMHEARTLAQELAHPYSLAFAFQHVTRLHQWRRDVPATLAGTEAMMALCAEHEFGQYAAQGKLLHGWALVTQGQRDTGLDQMCQGLTAYEATGAAVWRPYFLAVVAEGYGHLGAADEGLRVLAEALAAVQQTGECLWEAELQRLQGELLLTKHTRLYGTRTRPLDPSRLAVTMPSVLTAAAASFRDALTMARHQQAKSLELRAAMSLARVWQQQGQRGAAHDLLAPIYHWFTEGFDTADLQEAKALLEALA
jgi:DNA-binding winged helix-turn-helix (wHTH) protein/predicted ATPase